MEAVFDDGEGLGGGKILLVTTLTFAPCGIIGRKTDILACPALPIVFLPGQALKRTTRLEGPCFFSRGGGGAEVALIEEHVHMCWMCICAGL